MSFSSGAYLGSHSTASQCAVLAYYKSLGITVKRVMTDNGSCYKSHAFRKACQRLGLRHVRTKPYTPKTNGKAERFIQTSLREWAYARAYKIPASERSTCRFGCIYIIGIGLASLSVIKHPSADRSDQEQPPEVPQLTAP